MVARAVVCWAARSTRAPTARASAVALSLEVLVWMVLVLMVLVASLLRVSTSPGVCTSALVIVLGFLVGMAMIGQFS